MNSSAVTKRRDTPESKRFWANVAKSAAYFRSLSPYKQALLIKRPTNSDSHDS